MIRTQIQLDESLYEQLRQKAVAQRRSMAACIREAIEAFLKQAESQENDLSEIAGKFRPLDHSEDLKDHDRVWSDAAVEGCRP